MLLTVGREALAMAAGHCRILTNMTSIPEKR
jgi:hypothetical protein